MPEIEIRPAVQQDIPVLVSLDHDYVSDHVWQMDISQDEKDMRINFRQIQLPRSVRVDYPRPPQELLADWQNRSALLVGLLDGQVIGYASLMLGCAPLTTWVTDLAVLRRLRRQGIASALLLAAQQWARQKSTLRLVLEMQPKNYPAICMAQKLGFDLCGYNDRYYINHDIALFFAKAVR
ncbi:MAG: GNAT family N-acetyltransferase [Anaerolineales bacterium]|nr:GNAT family N-acetyltransferase [Anaerolineales bacterium]